MDLDKLWQWNSRKLACRIRVETGNPAGDELRERFAELAGVDFRELLSDMKNNKKKKEIVNKLNVEPEGDKVFKEMLNRSHVLGAAQLSLQKMKESDEVHASIIAKNNLKKQFLMIPKSPPRRILLDIQRERAKPFRLPDQDEEVGQSSKLEKKFAKQIKNRKAVNDRTKEEEEAMKRSQESLNKLEQSMMAYVLPPYKGDMFGSAGAYLESMIYLSRMADAENKSSRKKAYQNTNFNQKDGNDLPISVESKLDDDSSRQENGSNDGINDSYIDTDAGSKLYCAISLCNWSRDPANANRLASEGAVRAIMQLIVEPNPKLVKFCSAAFRFMSEQSSLANSMIDENATTVIADVIGSTSDEFICYNLAIALVNLTRVTGKEAQLVDAATVLAFQNLVVAQPDLSISCARGLYNLTCVDQQYNYIERVIRALVALSTTTTTSVKHICAAAICNLSDLRSVRPRLVEEGAVNVLGQLARGAETRTRRICAVVLQNLSASKVCRVEMTSKNSISVAYSLSSDQDPIILRSIGLTLSRLATESVNIGRIIHENGITALCNIGIKYPTIPGISQPVAIAFQLLSSKQSARMTIVQEGSITSLASLLRISSDLLTIQHALLALCNLLTESESHLPIVQQGLIITLMNLISNDNNLIKDFSSLAFFNLSCAIESRKHIVNSGAIVAISLLSKHENDITKRRCAATLCHVSQYEGGLNRMVSDGIISCLVDLILSNDIETIHYACAGLCRLCITEDNAKLIMQSNGINNLVKGAIDRDIVTKQFCGAVLSALSFYDICRVPLCEYGILSVLKMLSSMNDIITKQRCLVAYANLSCDRSVQHQMVTEGVVKIIAELAESYQEINYISCAKALCNFACNETLRLRLAQDGGIYALLMICMVHSVDMNTKYLCVQAFLNMLDETTVDLMLSEGIIGSIANLSKLSDGNKIVHLCSILFNQLTMYPNARIKLVEKSSYLTLFFRLYELKNNNNENPTNNNSNINNDRIADDVQILIARTCANLVLCKNDNICDKAIEAGAIKILEKGISLSDEETSLQCLQALYSACIDNKFTYILSCSHNLLISLIKVANLDHSNNHDDTILNKYNYSMKILSMIGYDSKSRNSLHNLEVAKSIFELINTNFQMNSAYWLVLTIRFIVIGNTDPLSLIQAGIISSLLKLYDLNENNSNNTNELSSFSLYAEYIVEILRILCEKGGQLCIEYCSFKELIFLLSKISNIIPLNSNASYHISVILYLICKSNSDLRQHIAIPETIQLMNMIISNNKVSIIYNLY